MRSIQKALWTAAGLVGVAALLAAAPAAADILHLDDVIIDGSLCVGFDCVNGEVFGFDTIRLKENNTRIHFLDTSNSASFPRNDWQLTANDSSNGGAEKFSIDDLSNAKTPFTITANAPSHSLFVNASGRIGLKTNSPVVELHIKDGDTPTVRLEQDGSSGFQAQTWDMAGNETNFFIRDVTNGSKLAFRIRPNAPTSSIDIAGTSGNVGIGTTTPTEKLHISSSSIAGLGMISTGNNARATLQTTNTTGLGWLFGITDNSSNFRIRYNDTNEQVVINSADGNMTTTGTITADGVLLTSDRNLKTGINPLSGRETLARLAALPIAEWRLKEDESVLHVGPMAQDFFGAFGVGPDDRHISPMDASGIAMSAIQGLHQIVQEKDQALEALRLENAELAARLAALEAVVLANQ